MESPSLSSVKIQYNIENWGVYIHSHRSIVIMIVSKSECLRRSVNIFHLGNIELQMFFRIPCMGQTSNSLYLPWVKSHTSFCYHRDKDYYCKQYNKALDVFLKCGEHVTC